MKQLFITGINALLAVENHQLAMSFAVLREESAHFRKKDCFECLSPRKEMPERIGIMRPACKAA